MPNNYRHKDHSVLAFFEETTAGQPPADWSDSGVRIDHTAVEFDGLFDQEILVDPRMEGQENDWADVGQRELIKGARGSGTGTFSMLLTGVEDLSPSDGAAPSETALSKLLKHCLGGQDIGTSHDVTGGTTTSLTMASTTGLELGAFVGVQDLTSPSSENSGRVFIRRITALVVDTSVTLDEALPFTPANGDLAVGCITHYVDPDVLEDSTGAAGRTLSLYHAGKTSEQVHVAYACALTMGLSDLSRNAVPQVAFTAQCGNWGTSPAVSQDADTWAAAGIGAQIIGRYTRFWFEDYGTTTSTKKGIGSMEIGPLVERSKIEAITSGGENLESMVGYSSTAGTETTVTLNIAGYDDDWEADLQADTYKVARYAHESQPGKSWAIHFPRCQIRQTPKPSPVSDIQGTSVTLLACRDTTTTATTALWRSKVAIVLC